MRELTAIELDVVAGGDTIVAPVVITSPGDPWGQDFSATTLEIRIEYPNPNPTIPIDGGIENLYEKVMTLLFGDIYRWMERDNNTTFNAADPNIVATVWHDFNIFGNEVKIPAKIMSDGTWWYDLTGDGRPETHVGKFGGELWYDSNNDGTFDQRF